MIVPMIVIATPKWRPEAVTGTGSIRIITDPAGTRVTMIVPMIVAGGTVTKTGIGITADGTEAGTEAGTDTGGRAK